MIHCVSCFYRQQFCILHSAFCILHSEFCIKKEEANLTKRRILSFLFCIALICSLATTALASGNTVTLTYTYSPEETQILIPLTVPVNGSVAGVHFTIIDRSPGLEFIRFVPSPSVAGVSIMYPTTQEGQSYTTVFCGGNYFHPDSNNNVLFGSLEFEYIGEDAESFTVTSIKVVELANDNDDTISETIPRNIKVDISRAEPGVPPVNPSDPSVPGIVTDPIDIGDPDGVPLTPDIDLIVYKPFMNGYPDGRLGPNDPLTRAELAQMIYNLYSVDDTAQYTATFADTDDHWGVNAIAFCQTNGFMNGYPDGTFLPDRNLTRAELSKTVFNIKNMSAAGEAPFPDVSGHWASEEIGALYAAEIIGGYPDGTFMPENNITRAETAKIICLADERDEDLFDTFKDFPDLDASHWGYKYLMSATNGYNYNSAEE